MAKEAVQTVKTIQATQVVEKEATQEGTQLMGREINIIGIDPGLTKTGIGILKINLEKDGEMGLYQFIVSNYLLLLNLQNLSKELINSKAISSDLDVSDFAPDLNPSLTSLNSLDSLASLNLLNFSNFISKKRKKTKKEISMDDRLLRFIRQSSFLCEIDLSKISTSQMIEIIKAPSVEGLRIKGQCIKKQDTKKRIAKESRVKRPNVKGHQEFLDDKEYFEIYLSLYRKYFGDLPIFSIQSSCFNMSNQMPKKNSQKNAQEIAQEDIEENIEESPERITEESQKSFDEVFYEIYDGFAKKTVFENCLEKRGVSKKELSKKLPNMPIKKAQNAKNVGKIEKAESADSAERSERKILDFLPSFVDQDTVYTKTSMPIHLRLKFIYDRIEQMVKKHSPSHMILEEVFVNSSNPMSALKLGGARGVISLIAANYNMSLIEIFAGKIKQRITFSWHEDKSNLKTIIYQIFQQNFQCSLDASDAIAGAICGILEMRIDNVGLKNIQNKKLHKQKNTHKKQAAQTKK